MPDPNRPVRCVKVTVLHADGRIETWYPIPAMLRAREWLDNLFYLPDEPMELENIGCPSPVGTQVTFEVMTLPFVDWAGLPTDLPLHFGTR